MTDQPVGQPPLADSTPVSTEEAEFNARHAEDLAEAPAEGAPEAIGTPAEPGVVVEPEDDDADDAAKNKGKFVRHGAFHQERERRKALEAKLQERDAEFARMNERLNVFNQLIGNPGAPAPAPETPPPPDAEADPVGYVRYLSEQAKENMRAAAEMQRAAQEQQQFQQIVGAYRADAESFARDTPDFSDAYNHLLAGRHSELQLYGVADARQREQIIAHEERQLVAAILKSGRRPAQAVYDLARARGYRPTAAETPAPSAAGDVQRIAQAQAGARSLSSMSGSPGKTEPTLEDLAAMSDAEFARVEASTKRRLMGG